MLTLHYRHHPVARVEETGSDFPAIWGRYELIEGTADAPQLRRVMDYIEMSVRTWPLIESDQADKVAEEEAAFTDLIECNDWALVDSRGQRTAIFIPVFETNGGINWRLSPEGDSAP